MFNKKLIEELRKTIQEQIDLIDQLTHDNNELSKKIGTYEEKFHAINLDLKNIPEGCKIGEHCRACEFGKVYRIDRGFSYEIIRVCGKADSCQNFVKRKDVEDVAG